MKRGLVCISLLGGAILLLQYTLVEAEAGKKLAKVVLNNAKVEDNNTYAFEFGLDTGVTHTAMGTLQEVNGSMVYVVKGAYTYLDDKGMKQTFTYVVDEKGLHGVAE